MSNLTKNIIGYGSLGIGWSVSYCGEPVLALPFFGVALIIFTLVLASNFKG
jgi:hypothetical protein